MSTIRLQVRRLDTYELFPISRSFKFGGASEIAIANDAERFRLQLRFRSAARHGTGIYLQMKFKENMIFQSPNVIKLVKQDPKVVRRGSAHSCGRDEC